MEHATKLSNIFKVFNSLCQRLSLLWSVKNKPWARSAKLETAGGERRAERVFRQRWEVLRSNAKPWQKAKFLTDNPNTFAGLVGKVRKKLSPEGGRKGGWRKKARAARPPDPGLEPGTCRVLGEGPPLHARGAV